MTVEERLIALEGKAHVADLNAKALVLVAAACVRIAHSDGGRIEIEMRALRVKRSMLRNARKDTAVVDLALLVLEGALAGYEASSDAG